VRIERHVDGRDAVEVGVDEGADPHRVCIRARHGQRSPAVKVDLVWFGVCISGGGIKLIRTEGDAWSVIHGTSTNRRLPAGR
jgi:hypothetical protein